MRYLIISSFTVKDFHAQDVAKTTLFMFGKELLNLSKIISDHVCKLTPYKIHVLVKISLEIKGKLHANDVEIELLVIPSSSIHKGNVLTSHSSIL